jgi:hypothetical protein
VSEHGIEVSHVFDRLEQTDDVEGAGDVGQRAGDGLVPLLAEPVDGSSVVVGRHDFVSAKTTYAVEKCTVAGADLQKAQRALELGPLEDLDRMSEFPPVGWVMGIAGVNQFVEPGIPSDPGDRVPEIAGFTDANLDKVAPPKGSEVNG